MEKPCDYVNQNSKSGTHAPHHATPEWIKNISAIHLFDKGWIALREQFSSEELGLSIILR